MMLGISMPGMLPDLMNYSRAHFQLGLEDNVHNSKKGDKIRPKQLKSRSQLQAERSWFATLSIMSGICAVDSYFLSPNAFMLYQIN